MFRYGPSTRTQDTLLAAAGYHPPVIVGTVYTLFGHCATPSGHAGCPEWLEVGVTEYACSCPHHRPAAWSDELQAGEP